MSDCLYVAACDPYFMIRHIEFINFDKDNYKLRARLKGENWDLKRHGGYGTEVKAITHSAMKISQSPEVTNIWVIVDI